MVLAQLNHAVNIAWRRMIRAPNAGDGQSNLAGELDSMNRVTPAALDRCNVEPEDIACLMGAANMESGGTALEMALVCRFRPGSLANLADVFVSLRRDEANTFGVVQKFRIGEFHLRRPECADNMDPIVPRGALQRFSGVDGAPSSLLLLSPSSAGFSDHFPFKSFLLPLAVRLLLVGYPQRFH